MPQNIVVGYDAQAVAQLPRTSTPGSRRRRRRRSGRRHDLLEPSRADVALRGAAVLDLRLIRERAGGRARGARAPRPGARERPRRGPRARRPAGARSCPSSSRCAPRSAAPRTRSRPRGAPARTPRRRSRGCARSARQERELEQRLAGVDAALQRALARAAEPSRAPTPPTRTRSCATVGEPRGGPALDHLELAGPMIDMEAAARLSGARFAYLKGDLVMLELALVRWALERRARARLRAGDPARARARAGALRDRLPARHRAADLPPRRRRALPDRHLGGRARLAARRRDPRGGERCRAATPASRRASAARPGRPGATRAASSACTSSTRSRCSRSRRPTQSAAEHERILAIEESLLRELEIPYRVVNIAVGDLGASAAKKYDCEAWLPSQERYRELTSCSNTTDYQARG